MRVLREGHEKKGISMEKTKTNEVVEESIEVEVYEKPKKMDKVKDLPKKVGGAIKKHAKGFAVGVASTAALAAAGAVMAVRLRDGAIETPLDLEGEGGDLPFDGGTEA